MPPPTKRAAQSRAAGLVWSPKREGRPRQRKRAPDLPKRPLPPKRCLHTPRRCMFGGCGECKPAPRQPKPRKHPCLITEPAVDAVNPPTEVDKRWDAVADFRAEAAVAAGRGKRLAASVASSIGKRIGVGAAQLRRLCRVSKWRSMFRRPGSGRPSKTTPELREWFLQTSKDLSGHWTIRQMALLMKEKWGRGSSSMVWRFARELGFRHLHMHVRPFLSAEHMAARLAWVQELLKDPKLTFAEPDTVYVHIDEKWFYALLLGRRLWVAEGDKPPIKHIASKRFIHKAMFLAAVAKPVSEHGFDGRIGFYPVAMRVTAKRDGKLRKKGGEFWKSVNMDAALFKEFLKHKIVPDALRATGSWARKIIIQMDNAGGHGGGKGDISKTTLAELNSWATNLPDDLLKLCPQGPPVFEFVAQPPRSPDLNVLDLGVWTSLQVAVDKLKHDKGNDSPTVSELFDCCIDAWSKWPADKVLDKIFKTLVNVLSFIEEEKGGNDYTLPHQNQVNKFS